VTDEAFLADRDLVERYGVLPHPPAKDCPGLEAETILRDCGLNPARYAMWRDWNRQGYQIIARTACPDCNGAGWFWWTGPDVWAACAECNDDGDVPEPSGSWAEALKRVAPKRL
jgi:hypothetical protein